MSLYFRMQGDKGLRFKPPPSETAKEAIAALKAQLQMELQNIKQCAYQAYECTELTLEDYQYCLRHILQDKNAPYKQCTYVYNSNGKRCHLPAPKDKKESGYCNEHALKAHLASSKRGSRCQPPRTAEVLLHSVSHYIKKPRTRTVSSSTQQSDESRGAPEDSNDGLTTKSLDPFVDVDAAAVIASSSDILDMCSESESDVDASTYGSVWHDTHADSSDNDSIDSEQEDVLKHANVYTAEEVTLITRDKLMRLQSLYVEQFRYLHHMLRERRRRYLHSLKREKETFCSIYNQLHDTPKEQRLYKKLKAYNSYHKQHGVEAICHERVQDRRKKVNQASAGIPVKSSSFAKCIFTEGGVKCGVRVLPGSRHCRKHILEDPNQILFRACGKMRGGMECTTPVETIFDNTTCRLHMDIPPIRSYAQNRKDSESDYEDVAEAGGYLKRSTLAANQNYLLPIKSEFNDNAVEAGSSLMDFHFGVKQEVLEGLKGEDTFDSENQSSLEPPDFVSYENDVGMPLAFGQRGMDVCKVARDGLGDDMEVCRGFASHELSSVMPGIADHVTENPVKVPASIAGISKSMVEVGVDMKGVLASGEKEMPFETANASNLETKMELECNVQVTTSNVSENVGHDRANAETKR